jgi:hypothetical protein
MTAFSKLPKNRRDMLEFLYRVHRQPGAVVAFRGIQQLAILEDLRDLGLIRLTPRHRMHYPRLTKAGRDLMRGEAQRHRERLLTKVRRELSA